MDLITAFFGSVGALRLGWFPPNYHDLRFLLLHPQQSAWAKSDFQSWHPGANIPPFRLWGKLFQRDAGLRLTRKKETAFDIPNHQPPASKSLFDGWRSLFPLKHFPKRSLGSEPVLGVLGYFQSTLRPSFWPPKPPFFWNPGGFRRFRNRMAVSISLDVMPLEWVPCKDGGKRWRYETQIHRWKRVSWVGDLNRFWYFAIW